MNTISRRKFLYGCSGALAGMAGAKSFRAEAASSVAGAGTSEDLLVVVFLRGGCDGLNMVPPLGGDDRHYYETGRPTIQLPLSSLLPLDSRFGLHPALSPLYPLYQQGVLAVVHAVGLAYDTRSHFDAQTFIELGTPGRKSTTDGWLTRHLATASVPAHPPLISALAVGNAQPTSLRGFADTLVVKALSTFTLNGYSKYRNEQHVALRSMYDGDHWLFSAGTTALDALDVIDYLEPESYTPSPGAVYPSGPFGDQLQVVAQLAKFNSGLRVVTIDLSGWDTHISVGNPSTGDFALLLNQLAQGLAAFYKDLDGAANQNITRRLTVVVQTEFGRRLRENANRGTDHGHGGVMLVLGGHVNGGAVYGSWPGLNTDKLYDRGDLAVTTDYRQVLAEIVSRRLNNANLSTVFPNMGSYVPLGILQGADA